MLPYTHFTLLERECLEKLLSQGYSMRKAAAFLGRSPSSVSREIKRNKAKYKPHDKISNDYWYNSWRAETLYICRRRQAKRYRLNPNTPEWEYIVEKLNEFWTPEEIVFRWRKDNPESPIFGVSTVYRTIKRKAFPSITQKTHLRRRGKRQNKKESQFNTIHPERIIPEWPEEIRERMRIGDWEGDTVYGGIGKGALLTEVDRQTRFLRAALLHNRSAELTKNTMVKLLKGLPVKSISLDNGSEFAEFKAIERELNTKIYFAEPHKPWQRGTNENTNDILRFFFPKGFDFHSITQEDLDYVVDLINNRPRKCLNWCTPAELFFKK